MGEKAMGAVRRNAVGLSFLPSLVCLLLFSFICGCSDKKVVLRSGQPAPGFSLADMTGKTVKVPADLKGSVVVIRFWADWCKSCAEEMPLIEKVYKQHADKGLVILAVNIGQERDVVEKFLKGLNISYTVLLDPGGLVTKRYGIAGLPTTIILDREGIIRQKVLGETGKKAFEEIVLERLNK